MFNGKIHYKWQFSIVMLDYQRVNPIKSNETTIFLWFSCGFPNRPPVTSGHLRSPPCQVAALQAVAKATQAAADKRRQVPKRQDRRIHALYVFMCYVCIYIYIYNVVYNPLHV